MADFDMQKKIKALRKKLMQIQRLKEKAALTKEESDKVASESALLAEIEALERGEDPYVTKEPELVQDAEMPEAEPKDSEAPAAPECSFEETEAQERPALSPMEAEKRIKALKKKLAQIEKLKERKGQLLTEELEKVASEGSIQAEVLHLEIGLLEPEAQKTAKTLAKKLDQIKKLKERGGLNPQEREKIQKSQSLQEELEALLALRPVIKEPMREKPAEKPAAVSKDGQHAKNGSAAAKVPPAEKTALPQQPVVEEAYRVDESTDFVETANVYEEWVEDLDEEAGFCAAKTRSMKHRERSKQKAALLAEKAAEEEAMKRKQEEEAAAQAAAKAAEEEKLKKKREAMEAEAAAKVAKEAEAVAQAKALAAAEAARQAQAAKEAQEAQAENAAASRTMTIGRTDWASALEEEAAAEEEAQAAQAAEDAPAAGDDECELEAWRQAMTPEGAGATGASDVSPPEEPEESHMVPATTEEAQHASPEKRIRNLRKKLGQIERLKSRGGTYTTEEAEKISHEAAILEEIAALERGEPWPPAPQTEIEVQQTQAVEETAKEPECMAPEPELVEPETIATQLSPEQAQKRIRALRKKLSQIARLKERGGTFTEEENDKISHEEGILAELKELESYV